MYKSEFLRRNEELIEFKRLVLQFCGVVETIRDTLHLWKRTYKFDELWEVFWYHEDDEGALEISTARIRSSVVAAKQLVRTVANVNNSLAKDIDSFIEEIKRQHFEFDLLTARSTKEKISLLEPMARDCLLWIDIMLEEHWRALRRKDSGLSPELVHEAASKMKELIAEAEGQWSLISGLSGNSVREMRDMGQAARHTHQAAV